MRSRSSPYKCSFHCQTAVCCLCGGSWSFRTTNSTPGLADSGSGLQHSQDDTKTWPHWWSSSPRSTIWCCWTSHWPYTPATNPLLVSRRTGRKPPPLFVLQRNVVSINKIRSILLVKKNLTICVLSTDYQWKKYCT